MNRSRLALLPAVASLGVALLASATSVYANVGVTSVTSGDPLGQPPASPERVLRVGIDIQANEIVSTRVNDRAHLVFLDGTSLTVGPNSTIVIDKYVFDPGRNAGELSLSATKGVFRFVGGAISKTNEIKVTTPSATIGIRGGIATVEVAENGGTKATFLYGEKMTVAGQGHIQTATRNGSQIEAVAGRPPTPPAIVPPNGLAPTAVFERAPTPAAVGQAPAQVLQPQISAVAAAPVIATPIATTQIAVSPATNVLTPTINVAQIDTALTNSELSKSNSLLPQQQLRRDARFNSDNRGRAVAAGPRGQGTPGGPGKQTAGPMVAAGPSRLSAPNFNAVLRQVGVANRQVVNNTARVQQGAPGGGRAGGGRAAGGGPGAGGAGGG
ncbi:MAG: FecR domain-containing protein, partial [Acidimicrobiia bacterium]